MADRSNKEGMTDEPVRLMRRARVRHNSESDEVGIYGTYFINPLSQLPEGAERKVEKRNKQIYERTIWTLFILYIYHMNNNESDRGVWGDEKPKNRPLCS